jgi:hypothetical protein
MIETVLRGLGSSGSVILIEVVKGKVMSSAKTGIRVAASRSTVRTD